MKASEIRSSFLNYFKKNGHALIESASLVPQNDPTLLFTNAGMVPFKDVFLGKEQRSYVRATSSQKCIRAGGKHNDLENVGLTARHHTFFEMLGNFSFGDYFKKEAIHFAWEFTTRELGLNPDVLYVSVYEKDDESAEIWHVQEGVPQDRIYRLGEKDNFWSMAETGPCGPCSEIFIDRGQSIGCQQSSCRVGCHCDRFVEFWNLVFMQFNRSLEGQLTLLPKPAVDTGAGLERLASILQKTKTNYETDLFSSLIHSIAESLVTEITTESQISLRVIADHARATTFLMSDGVFPAPEGRGYVLRRIMRRAIRHGKKLGFQEPFLYRSVESVINLMQDTYPDLKEKRALIQKAVQAEEEQFFRTLEKGLVLLEQSYEQLPTGGTLSGEIAFKLYDTYGFPLDLTQLLSAEKGFRVDEVGFQKGMQKQRMESRKHWKGSGQQILNEYDLNLVDHLKQLNQLPQFLGYSQFEVVSQCVAWFSEESNQWQSMRVSTEESQSQHLKAIFLETPFYAESGGQLADQGKVLGQNFEAEVVDVQRPVPELIVLHLNILKGTLQVGEKYQQLIDLKKRTALSRHHTATHLLHWALRKVLGEHVKQAGSLVTHEILRFDFTHFQPLSSEQWIEIEDLMNEKIWSGASVEKQEMHKEQALQLGALAFFGEKYSDRVRVVQIGNFSKELCGGTHVEALTELHLVKIVQEVGIAAGVRRIIACSAQPAFQYLRGKDQDLKRIKDQLRVSSSEEILGKIKKMQTLEKDHQQQLEQWYSQHIKSLVQIWFEKVEWIQGVPCLFQCVREEGCNMKMLRDLADALKQKLPQGVIVLGAQENDRGLLLVACGAKVPSIIRAQDLIAVLAPFIEGKGGGKADLAQAGGSYIAGLSEALKQARDWLLRKLT